MISRRMCDSMDAAPRKKSSTGVQSPRGDNRADTGAVFGCYTCSLEQRILNPLVWQRKVEELPASTFSQLLTK
jgi:hypothetical protein